MSLEQETNVNLLKKALGALDNVTVCDRSPEEDEALRALDDALYTLTDGYHGEKKSTRLQAEADAEACRDIRSLGFGMALSEALDRLLLEAKATRAAEERARKGHEEQAARYAAKKAGK